MSESIASTASTASTTSTGVASVPEAISLADGLLDQVVAFRPIREDQFETQLGNSMATLAQLVTVDDEGHGQDRGELPIFWVVVRDQLRQSASPDTPWVAGIFAKEGRAYRLLPLTPDKQRLVEKALAALFAESA